MKRRIAVVTLVAASQLLPSIANANQADTLAASIDQVWVLTAAALVFMMQCGFLCLEIGAVQPKAATITALKNVVDWMIAAAAFFFGGWALMFGHTNGFVGTDMFMLEGSTDGGLAIGPHVHFIFQLAFAGTSATIVSGALAERTSFGAYMLTSLVVTTLIYPVYGHWAWGNSFFASNETFLTRLHFMDFAGSTVVHSIGGWVSLVGIIFVGPRLGRFDADGRPRELPQFGLHWHALATLLLWFCWWGFNGGSTLTVNSEIAPIIINTNLAGTFGGFGAMLHCSLFEGRQHLSGKFLNGTLAGLVGVTAGCAFVSPIAAVLIGFSSGIVMNLVTALLLKLKLDDPVGAVPVHLGAGVWGTFCAGLFARSDVLEKLHHTRLEQIGIQLLGVVTCAGWVVGASALTFWFIKRVIGLRVSPLQETSGFDLTGAIKPAEEPFAEDELVALLGANER